MTLLEERVVSYLLERRLKSKIREKPKPADSNVGGALPSSVSFRHVRPMRCGVFLPRFLAR